MEIMFSNYYLKVSCNSDKTPQGERGVKKTGYNKSSYSTGASVLKIQLIYKLNSRLEQESICL